MAIYTDPKTGSLRDVIIWVVEEIKKLKAQILKISSGGSGGIPEAPIDDSQYGRKNSTWTKATLQTMMDEGSTWIKSDSSAYFSIDDPALSGNDGIGLVTNLAQISSAPTGFQIRAGDTPNQIIFGALIPISADLSFKLDNTKPSGTYIICTKDDLKPQIQTTVAATILIVPTKGVVMITFTGTVTTATLPPISSNDGLIIFLTNAGSSTSILNSNAGGNDIWEGGTNLTTTNIPNGSIMRIINDGIKYRVL